MKENMDYIDEIIEASFKDVDVSSDYNSRLFNKIQEGETLQRLGEKRRMAALSFITAGFLMLVISTSSLNEMIISMRTEVKTSISTMQVTALKEFNVGKIFLGE